MKLAFHLFGVEVYNFTFSHDAANDVSDVVLSVEQRGKRLAGKAVDRFSTMWMRSWVNK